jgi:pimeloyl-ACP methyl ester carboxylesterase
MGDAAWVPPTTDGFLTLDGTAVHIVSWLPQGEAAPGPPVLLIHGLGGSTVLWERVGGTLGRRLGSQVVAVDLPGFGRSRARNRGTAIADSSRVIGELLRRLGPALVLASSMGAAVAVHATARSPRLVQSLTLVGAALSLQRPHAWPPPVPDRVWVAMLPGIGPPAVGWYARALTAEEIVDDRLAAWCVDVSRVDAGFRRRLIELAAERKGFPEGARAYADAARSLYWYLAAPAGISADLRRVGVPTMLVHGEHDRVVRLEVARALARRHPEVRLTVVDDCGHVPHLECPERFVSLVAAHLEGGPASRPAPAPGSPS